MSASSEVRDLDESKQEALRALLTSLTPGGQISLPNDADVTKLAEKLDELLASKGGLLGAQGITRDDQGRPLNDEGLPIMEIVEPVTDDSSADPPTSVSGQAPLSPLPNWALSPAALSARRRKRDRILDVLEREEEQELAREASSRVPTTNAPVPGPRTLDQVVLPRVDASRPVLAAPVKVPTALEHTSTNPGPSKDLDKGVLHTAAARKPKKQKSVSFADPTPPAANQDIDWGDVVPIPFNPRNLPTPGPGIMKELVVERLAGSPSGRVEDSDDEDEEAEAEDEEVKAEDDMSPDDASDGEVPAEALRPSEESDESEDEPATDVHETDFDEAMLQREIALAYYARRSQIGSDVASGPLSDSTALDQITSGDGGANIDDQSNTTRFRRSRLNGDPQTLINSAVQFGKLVDGQLVAGQVADQEVEASVNELTGGSGDKEDLTEKTIALLMHGRDEPAVLAQHERSPNQSSGSHVVSQSQTALEPTSRAQPRPLTSSVSPQRPNFVPTATVSAFPPTIVESGFGFDPAFQVAPKPPASTAAKRTAPMTEMVKERLSASTTPVGHGRGKSRFAQASRTGEVKSQSSPTKPNADALWSQLIANTADPATVVQPPEPKRISRFRAERAGYM